MNPVFISGFLLLILQIIEETLAEMAGAYEAAFQEWLKKSKGENSSTSTATRFQRTYQDKTHFPSTAPFLVDDDEDQESGEYFKNLGTGPPVLEPVSHHPHAQNVFDAVDKDIKEHSKFTTKHSSFSNKTYTTLDKPVKTYSAYGNTHKSPQKKKRFESDSKEEMKTTSGNIFDKFSPEVGLYTNDSPPPLIPSPMAISEDPEFPLQSEPGKYAVKSPDFCAMEADSTSELQSFHKGQERLEKGGNGELSLECDSTCMLGGSPSIVSPASNSTQGDVEDAGDLSHGPKQLRNVEIQCNSDSLDEKPKVTAKPAIKNNTISFHGSAPNKSIIKEDTGKDSVQTLSGKVDRNCKPHLEDKGVEVDLTNTSSNIDLSSDLPVLKAGALTANQSVRRKQRHTVDTAEGFSKSRKISSEDDFDTAGPPPLLLMQGNETSLISTQNRPKGKRIKSSRSVKSKTGLKSNRPCYMRSNTVPATSHLNQDTMQFARALWQLSQLQSRMHALLSGLWPQLQLDLMTPESPQFRTILTDLVTELEGPYDRVKDEEEQEEPSSLPKLSSPNKSKTLKDMPDFSIPFNEKLSSPESPSLEEQRSLQGPSATLTFDHCSNHKAIESSQSTTQITDNHKSSSFLNQSGLTHQSTTEASTEDLPPVLVLAPNTGSSQQKQQQQQQQTDEIESSDETSINQQTLPPRLSWNPTCSSVSLTSPSETECPIPGLAQLSLAEEKEVCLKPLSIILLRDPDSVLLNFSGLCCRALQSLLPEVPVSLTNELSCSPKALISFIDNVLAVNDNSKRSSRKKKLGI